MARMCTGKQISAWAMTSQQFKSEHGVEITKSKVLLIGKMSDFKIETFNEAWVQFYHTKNDNPDIPVHKRVLWGRSVY